MKISRTRGSISHRLGHKLGLGSAALLLSLAGATAQAQPAQVPGARGDGPQKAWVHHSAASERHGGFMRRLDLSDEQRAQITGIRERSRAEIAAVLTPEQRAKMAELREQRGGHGRRKPRPGS